MKASAFLKLVEEVLTKQQDYFKAKRQGDPRQKDLLIASKELEKRTWAVIKQGSLEPDEPTATVHVFTTEEYQRQLNLELSSEPAMTLDAAASQRGDVAEQNPLFTDGER